MHQNATIEKQRKYTHPELQYQEVTLHAYKNKSLVTLPNKQHTWTALDSFLVSVCYYLSQMTSQVLDYSLGNSEISFYLFFKPINSSKTLYRLRQQCRVHAMMLEAPLERLARIWYADTRILEFSIDRLSLHIWVILFTIVTKLQ